MTDSHTDGNRALVLTERNAESRKWHAFQYEFEDVVASVDDVTLLAPPDQPVGPLRYARNRALRFAGHRRRYSEPDLRPVRIVRDYDLFFAIFAFVSDIPHLLKLRDLRKRCGLAACFIVELFSEQVDGERDYLELLRQFEFDRVFLFNPAPADAVAEIAGCPVEFLPLGVDALRFSPYPHPPERCIDIYQFGRRPEVTHAAALEMARADGIFYVYDTVFDANVPDARAHRTMMAETLKRSRYFFAYRAGEDLERAQRDDPLSARYFESIASGTIVLGNRPSAWTWDECFGWDDSVIDIPYAAHDLRDIVAGLDAQPERLARARANNVANSLRRNDTVHQWARVLDSLGMPHTPAMRARMDRLEELAAMAEAG